MTEATQEVRINGKPMTIPAPCTVAGLLDHLSIGRKHVAVERNRRIVAKSDYDTTELSATDELEIVTLVGGG